MRRQIFVNDCVTYHPSRERSLSQKHHVYEKYTINFFLSGIRIKMWTYLKFKPLRSYWSDSKNMYLHELPVSGDYITLSNSKYFFSSVSVYYSYFNIFIKGFEDQTILFTVEWVSQCVYKIIIQLFVFCISLGTQLNS